MLIINRVFFSASIRKFARIFIHVGLDLNAYFLWEFPGTIIESVNSTYPEYTYYLVYDKENNLVRAIPGDSEEGGCISNYSWVNHTFDLWRDCDGVNEVPTSLRLAPEQR